MKKLYVFAVVLNVFLFPQLSFASFPDTEGHRYEDAINYVQMQGIVEGAGDGNYYPDQNLNRAEFTKIIVLSIVSDNPQGSYCFPDVTTEWYAPYVCTAYYNDILNGYPDGTFGPWNNVTYAEALKIVLNAYDAPVDYSVQGEWYEAYLQFASNNNLSFASEWKPGWFITRGQMAEIIYWMDYMSFETLPAEEDEPVEYICSSDAYNCDDANVQAIYGYCMDLGYGDIHRLDLDNDGYACE